MLAYNHGAYIRKAIESVVDQVGDFPIELLIGEDGSTDNTLEIAREFERSAPGKVRVITSPSNVGMLQNLRRLESASRSKYVAYCEADDYWHDSEKLKKQVDFLESHPDYALVHTEYQTKFVETGRIIPNAARQPTDLDDADAFNEILSGRRLVLTLTACIRSSTLNEMLSTCPECYDSRFLMGDTQRWLELSRRGKVKCLHEVTATHLIISESASQSKNPKRVLRFILSTKDVLEYYIKKYGCPPEIKAAALSRVNIGVLACAYAAGDFETATKTLKEHRESKLSPTVLPWLYYFGSRSPSNKMLVRPGLTLIQYWNKISRKAGQIVNSRS